MLDEATKTEKLRMFLYALRNSVCQIALNIAAEDARVLHNTAFLETMAVDPWPLADDLARAYKIMAELQEALNNRYYDLVNGKMDPIPPQALEVQHVGNDPRES